MAEIPTSNDHSFQTALLWLEEFTENNNPATREWAKLLLTRLTSAHETSVEMATLRTMTTAIGEAQDLLECAQPAEHLEGSSPEDWYSERDEWLRRNTFEEKASPNVATRNVQAGWCPHGYVPSECEQCKREELAENGSLPHQEKNDGT